MTEMFRTDVLERVGFDRIHVFTRQVEAAFAKHNAFNLSGEYMNPIKPDTLQYPGEQKARPDDRAMGQAGMMMVPTIITR